MLGSAVIILIPSLLLRQTLLALCNFGFLASMVSGTAAWVALIVFLASGYLATRLLQEFPRRILLVTYLCALVLGFIVIKQYAFLKPMLPAAIVSQVVVVVGLSYMLFRQIHLAVDAFQGQIKSLPLWRYLNYQLNLFGLTAGPIQRYQDFSLGWDRLQPLRCDFQSVTKAYLRVFIGVIKIMILAPPCLEVYEAFARTFLDLETPWKAIAKFALLLYLYPAYIYFNFSGYCDMVIAGASLVGLKMPENFNLPFLARNMIDYWTRWHRTLGFWIRDYVFNPLYKAMVERWPGRALWLALICYFIALFLTGLWHGSTWNFVVFGLLNGLGVAAAKCWEIILTTAIGRQGFKKYMQSPAIRALAIVANFHFVCLTIAFFPADLERTWGILKHVGALMF